MIFKATCITDYSDCKYTQMLNSHGIYGYKIFELKDYNGRHKRSDITKAIELYCSEYDSFSCISIEYKEMNGCTYKINLEENKDLGDEEIDKFLYFLFLK